MNVTLNISLPFAYIVCPGDLGSLGCHLGLRKILLLAFESIADGGF